MKYIKKLTFIPALLMCIALIVSCGGSGTAASAQTEAPQAEEEAAIAVETARAEIGSISRYTQLSGNVVAKTSLDILAENNGRISGLSVKYGDYVEKDQVLALIDPSRPGMVYGKTELKAPMSGTVTALNISEGGYATTAVSAGTVTDLTDLRVSINIPEQNVTAVKLGDKVSLVFDAYPGETFTGEVTFLSPTLDRSSKSRAAEITVDTEKELIVGMYARVSILTAKSVGSVCVPTDALVSEGGRVFVYVVNGERVSARDVQTGLYDDARTEITGGLSAGESVVVKGQQQLRDGAKVSV